MHCVQKLADIKYIAKFIVHIIIYGFDSECVLKIIVMQTATAFHTKCIALYKVIQYQALFRLPI